MERRLSEQKNRRQRLVAGAVGGMFAGPIALIGILQQVGYDPRDWRVLVGAFVLNGVITTVSICFWDLRWYWSQWAHKRFGIPPRD